MPTARFSVIAVSDRGDDVVVWARPEDGGDDGDPIGYVFQTKGEHGDVALAERASQLVHGTEVVVEYVAIVKDWNLAGGLSTS